jgi:hypothetical protein
MTEYAHDDYVPDHMVKDEMQTLYEMLFFVDQHLTSLRKSIERIDNWFAGDDMTYGELVSIRDATTFLGRAEPIIEDAAAVIKDAVR